MDFNFILENWYFYLLIFAMVVLAAFFVYGFIIMPDEDKFKKISEWLIVAVAEAEKQFGSNTGQLKLRKVYDKFTAKFSFVSMFISFETFSSLVDKALVKFKQMLIDNKELQVETYGKELSKEEVAKLKKQIIEVEDDE